jgi:hypothetical protein
MTNQVETQQFPHGKFHVQILDGRGGYFRGVNIDLFIVDGGKVYRAKPINLEWEEVEPFNLRDEAATLRIPSIHAAPFLEGWAEALRAAGVKPSHLHGQIEAMQAHLQDMRALVFKTGMPRKQNE